jgi:hypothetical protein
MSISQLFPEEGPSLSLNLAASRILDPRITFTRTSSGTCMGPDGLIKVIPANSPRFDHRYVNGEVESLGLLIEEQRQNLLLNSVVSSSTWSVSSSTVTSSATTAPDGTNTAARVQVDTANGYVAILSISVTAGQSYTFSFWAKSYSGSSGTWGINIYDHGNNGFHNGTVRNITGEWTRISYTYTPVGNLINVYVSDDRNNLANINDGYVWGAQLESGAFLTSYIPTSGSTATRTADNAYIEGTKFSKFYNLNEGSAVCYFSSPTAYVRNNPCPFVFSINRNTIGWGHYIGSSGASVSLFRNSSGSNDAFLNTGSAAGTTDQVRKLSVGYKLDDFVHYVNIGGGNISQATDTLGQVRTDINAFAFNPQHSGLRRFNGHIQNFIYYPTKFSNTQLRNLAL